MVIYSIVALILWILQFSSYCFSYSYTSSGDMSELFPGEVVLKLMEEMKMRNLRDSTVVNPTALAR